MLNLFANILGRPQTTRAYITRPEKEEHIFMASNARKALEQTSHVFPSQSDARVVQKPKATHNL
jgi:hypothetical protein